MRAPSVKKLAEAFGDADLAKRIREVLKMPRGYLPALPGAKERSTETCGSASWVDLRMHAISALDRGFYGVEVLVNQRDDCLQYAREAWYVNTGDTYSPTILFWEGTYRLTTWGDFVERMERRGVKFL